MTEMRDLREIAAARIREGEKRRLDAAYGGEMSDRGGQAMIDEAYAFIAGLDGVRPSHWIGWISAIEKEEQAEREEYERLKAKFENPE